MKRETRGVVKEVEEELERTEEKAHEVHERHVERLENGIRRGKYVDIREMSGNGEGVGVVMLLRVEIIAECEGVGVSERDLGMVERVDDFFLQEKGDE